MTAGNSPKQSAMHGSTEQNKDSRRAGGTEVRGFKDGYLKKSRSDFFGTEGEDFERKGKIFACDSLKTESCHRHSSSILRLQCHNELESTSLHFILVRRRLFM